MSRKGLLEVRERVTGDAKCCRFDVMRELVKPIDSFLRKVVELMWRGVKLTDPNTVISCRVAHDATSPWESCRYWERLPHSRSQREQRRQCLVCRRYDRLWATGSLFDVAGGCWIFARHPFAPRTQTVRYVRGEDKGGRCCRTLGRVVQLTRVFLPLYER